MRRRRIEGALRSKRRTKSTTITVRMPAALIEEAKRVAPSRLGRSMTQLLQAGLQLLIIRRNREMFAKGWRRMARDPQARAVDRQIMKEFEVCDNDGLEGR
jgi:hypothetical protein